MIPETGGSGAGMRRGPQRFQLAICAIFQNEAPYLPECIEFHRLVGLEHFFAYDNASDDHAAEVLEPWRRAGLLTHIPWPYSFEEFAQSRAYNDCLQRFGADCRWLALIDIDEFLFAPGDTDLPTVLSEYEDFPAVVVHWQVYGSSGHCSTPPGLVTENFLHRAPTQWVRNRRAKTILNPARTVRVLNPHFAEYADGALAVNENRVPCRVKLANRESGKPWALFRQRARNRLGRSLLRLVPRLPLDPYTWSLTSLRRVSVARLRINHYATRSREEFEARSRRRREPGRAWSGLRVHDELRFRYHDRNDVRDDILLAYAPRLRRALEDARPAPA